MANYRQIHVSIWKDEWFLDLEPQEKLLFIYLFSNEGTSLSGLYKMPLKVIIFETGLSREYITDTLSKFEEHGKVMYQDGIVWVKNMRRYHETKSPKVQTRIDADLDLIPNCKLKIEYLYGIDTDPQLKEKEKEDEQEDEQEEEKELRRDSETPADKLQVVIETLTGVILTANDVKHINELIALEVTEDDIRAALDWRKEQNLKPVSNLGGLMGGIKTSRAKRIQGNHSRPAQQQETAGARMRRKLEAIEKERMEHDEWISASD